MRSRARAVPLHFASSRAALCATAVGAFRCPLPRAYPLRREPQRQRKTGSTIVRSLVCIAPPEPDHTDSRTVWPGAQLDRYASSSATLPIGWPSIAAITWPTLALVWDAQHLRLQPVPAGHSSTLHPEPMPTFATVLSGWIEITSSLGVTRRFGPGHGMLFLDTEGKGHAFAVALEPTALMIVRLQDGVARPVNPDLNKPN